jgi:hypothetical protein
VRISFLELPESERRLYIEEAASRRGVSAVIIEKDFWVSWMLAVLFRSELAGGLVFKGGTSLSKVFGAIDRFSEDIDLSLAPAFVGIDAPDDDASRTRLDRWMHEAQEACALALRLKVKPVLDQAVVQALGPSSESDLLEPAIGDSAETNLLFRYPSVLPVGFGYIRRAVKLEFGSLTDQQPHGVHAVRPWIAESIPDAFADWSCSVVALEAERTFWEKATILHAEHHRPQDKLTPDRFSRHYADLARLADHPSASAALAMPELRNRVVAWKGRFFHSAWARFDLARPGSFRLLPAPSRARDLARDYQAMREMYLTEPPVFDQVLDTLRGLEKRINDGL